MGKKSLDPMHGKRLLRQLRFGDKERSPNCSPDSASLLGFLGYLLWENLRHNYAYFPILIDEKTYGISRDAC
jgi:hypothetical protein